MTDACRTTVLALGCLLVLAGPATARDTTMVLVPAGEFVMGVEGTGDDSPPHTVRLRAYSLDRYEVTNAEYEDFCHTTGRDLPVFWGSDSLRSGPRYPDHPVVMVSRRDASDYAAWRGKRLPTEAEWERAARGGVAGRSYVMGDELDPAQANFTKSGRRGPVPVGSYAPNGYGLYDMAGNVQEWVADRYGEDTYRTGPFEDPRGPEKGRLGVVRGGGWYTGPGCMALAYRIALPANWCDINVGFRCARDAGPAPGAPPAKTK
jgi:formylglycine-generating enzyme